MSDKNTGADAGKSTRVALTVPPAMLDWVEGISELMLSPGTAPTITTMLGAFQDLLRMELRRLPLTLAEASCIADVLNGCNIISAPTLGPVVYAELSDAFSYATGVSSFGRKWGIDEETLRGRILALGPTADLSLRIAISRWWAKDHSRDEASFQEVGLTITPTPAGSGSEQ